MPLDVNEFISEALKEGYDINDVVGFMSKHPDEGYQKWASNWSATTAAPEYKAGSSDQQIKFDEEKNRLRQEFDQKLKQATTTNVMGFDIPSILTGPATAITGAAALGGAYLLGKKGLQSRSIKNPQVADAVGEMARVESAPVDYNVPAFQRKAAVLETAGTPIPKPAEPSPLEVLQNRAQEIKSAVQPPVQAPVQTPAPVQPPVVTAPVEPSAPSAAQAIAAGESPSKAVQMDVANQLDKESSITQRVRRTKAKISSELEAKMAKAPPGMLPSAPKKTNKLPGDVIGQGGWHWLNSQEGANTAAVWRDLFGDKNVKYDPVVEKYTDMMMSGGEPGRFPPSYSETRRQPYVPGHIKGSVSPGMLLNLAGNTLGAAGLLQAYKQGKETGDYSDFGLGAIGQILGNIAPKTSVGFSLMAPSETNKGEKEELAKRRKMKPTID